MEFRKVIQDRYSCKKYSARKVEEDKILAILEAGRLAPTAKNLQEQHIYVLQSEKDATIVATHLVIAAADEGVDSCWVNRFDPDLLKEGLGLPENEEILMLLDLGYAADDAKPLPNHFSRKDLSETVTYI